MLRLAAGQVESLWDEVLPVGVRELPGDLARIDALLGDPALLAPISEHWQSEAEVSGRSARAARQSRRRPRRSTMAPRLAAD